LPSTPCAAGSRSGPRLTLGAYYLYGVRLGARAMLKGRIVAGAKRILNPVSFWRCVEVPWVYAALQPCPGDRLLDIGSPKLLSLYLADRVGCRVCAIDLLSQATEEWAAVARAGVPGALWRRRYSVLRQDARSLPYRDAAFDKAYSISVLEHIPGDGDGRAMREIARVLKPGGRLAITVPFSTCSRDEFVARNVYERQRTGDEPVFYQRVYDRETLSRRLIEPSGLTVTRMDFYSGYDLWDRGYMRLPVPLRAALAPFQPPLAALMIRPIADRYADTSRYTLACLSLVNAGT
jgi:SAM-dependent methyltransferase